MSKPRQSPAAVSEVPAPRKTYVLRTCNADMISSRGFRWPEIGPVAAPDWQPTHECGHGLHGALMGVGDGSLLNWSPDAKWLVVEVDADALIDLSGKVKFSAGVVVFCGDRISATTDILARGADPATVIGGTATAGYSGTATAGDSGTATAGYSGTATAGDRGTATAGDSGMIIVRWRDDLTNRYRAAVGNVGEDGIEANVAYHVVGGHLLKRAV